MSYGFRTYKAANGSGSSWTSPVQRGILFLEVVTCSAAAGGVVTRSYPLWVGRTGRHAYFSGTYRPAHSVVWAYPNGVPTVTITASSSYPNTGTVLTFIE